FQGFFDRNNRRKVGGQMPAHCRHPTRGISLRKVSCSMTAQWRTVRVFISSTFRDMHAERDHLVKVVFARLRQWCAERRLHLVDIDLRWGVTEAEANNGQALDICL